MNQSQQFLLSLTLVMGLTAPVLANVAAEIDVQHAYVREVPPGQMISAAFMQLDNNDMSDHQVVAARSDAAEVVELHTHTHENGMMKMRQVQEINLPAGVETQLKPGGLHIMLIDLRAPLSKEEPVKLTLEFEDGSEKELSLPVKPVVMHH